MLKTSLNQNLIYKKFILQLMRSGKRVKAEKIFVELLFELSLRGYSPLSTIILAINNTKPLIEIRNVKIRGNLYAVPFPLSLKRQLTFSIRNFVKSNVSKTSFIKSIAEEIIKSSEGASESVKKIHLLHKVARQNKLFSHYRWF